MPSAANAKSEKPASSEALDNSPIRQIMTIIEHKIRNLEKRKSKLTSYRDLQKAGKELNSDQKVAVAKYDEVAQTLEFARDLSKQVTSIATSAEREAKKQAKKDAWVRYAAETSKIREVLLVLDCLNQMGNTEARNDFLNGTNGAVKLTEEDLKILDDLYPEVTPKHEVNEEGQPGFHIHTTKAAEHLYAIIDGKPKEILGTTYTHIKEIVSAVHECGYFDRSADIVVSEVEESHVVVPEAEPVEVVDNDVEAEVAAAYPPGALPVPPAPAVVPAPAYPLRPLPPITLQEVEHAYFAQQYPQQRPIAEHAGFPPAGVALAGVPAGHALVAPLPHAVPAMQAPPPAPQPAPPAMDDCPVSAPADDKHDDEVKESGSPERDDGGDRKIHGQGDGQARYRRFGRGGGGGGRGAPNGHRGRGAFQNRQGGEGYRGRHPGDYQGRSGKDGYQNRQYDGYQNRHGKDGYQGRGGDDRDGYYGNGDTGDSHQQNENGGRDRYNDNQSYQGGFKGRGRGGPRGGVRGATRPRPQYTRKPEKVE
uniref:Caprin-1 dimerization domain-containing protein n=1 Tax=Heliothis virescens TaxID=7102 RepID=A0A2A4JXQ5_HELVI